MLKISDLDFLHGKFAITVGVERLENLGEIVAFGLAHKLGSDESVSGLLEGDIRVEFTEVIKGVDGKGLINLQVSKFGDPWVLEGIPSGGSLLGVVGEKGTNETLTVLGDGLPDAIFERKLSFTNLLHDVLIRLTIERGLSGKNDIGDDTGGPDIALLVVALVEDLGGNVVRGSEFLIEVTVGIVDEGSTEIDDLDLIELLVLLEENVLGLEITMNDVGLMAIVDARKDLLHENGAITLAEFTSLKDFVEEFTTLADLSDKVVALLIFEELVHFDDIGVINFLQNIDLVEKHTFLIIVHVTLAKYLNSALGV